MMTSILRPPKGITQNIQKQITQVDNFVLFEIIIMKIIVVCMAVFLPLFLKPDIACSILTTFIALQFWINKNMARKFLKAHWFVDTSIQKDRWVFQAQINKTNTYEGLFWFSSLIYIILLAVCFCYYASKRQLSLSCSLFIGLICSYLNFFAYSKIMKARNSGILEKISQDVEDSPIQNGATIQMPLITVRSQLKQIKQNEEQLYMS